MIKNFIFDVDRTLVDSYKPELETLKEALSIVTKKEYSDAVMNKLTILPTDKFFRSLGIDPESKTMTEINYYWGLLLEQRKISFFEGIKELLLEMKEKGFFLGIVTSRTKEELNEIEDLLKYINLFNIVITSDMVTNAKPNPESLNIIINEFNLRREETIYIGDSNSDKEAAKNANISFGFANWENKNLISDYDYLFLEPQSIKELFQSKIL